MKKTVNGLPIDKEPMSYKTLIKIVLSVIFLVYVIFKIDLRSLYSAFLKIEPWYYILAFCISLLNCLIYALKFKIALNPSRIYNSFKNLVKINLLCRFYSTFLTASIGQSLIRWHYTTKNTNNGKIEFLAVFLFERSTFLFALFSLSGLSLILFPHPIIIDTAFRIFPFIIIFLLLILFFYIYLNFPPLFKSLNILLIRLKSRSKKGIIEKIFRIIETISLYVNQRKVLYYCLGLAFIWQLFYLLRVYLLVVSIRAPLDFFQVSWMASFVLLIQILPISLDGAGLREMVFSYLFGIYGIPPEKGVLLGLLLLTQVLLMSAMGGIVHVVSKD